MLRPVKSEEINRILEYLEKDLGNCVYLYMDIRKYGLMNPHMKVWVSEGSAPATIVMRYFDSLHVYGNGQGRDREEILQCIMQEKVQMVSGEKQLIDNLKKAGGLTEYFASKDGYVFCFTHYREFSCPEIETASIEDCQEIADLICMDAEFAQNYKAENLALQLKDRILTGMGRSYVIRKNGKIISHIATFAEAFGIAVTSGLIVHPQYREYSYGTMLESYLVNILQREGFRVYTFVNDSKRVKLLQAMGNVTYGQYEKLTRKRK